MSRYLYYVLFLSNVFSESTDEALFKYKSSDSPYSKLLQEINIPPWAKSAHNNYRVKRSLKYKQSTGNTEVNGLEASQILITSNYQDNEIHEKSTENSIVNIKDHNVLLKRTYDPILKKEAFSSNLTPFDPKLDQSNDNILNEVENETYRPDSNQLKDLDEKHYALKGYFRNALVNKPFNNYSNGYKSLRQIDEREDRIKSNSTDKLQNDDEENIKISNLKSYPENISKNNYIKEGISNIISLQNDQNLFDKDPSLYWDVNEKLPAFLLSSSKQKLDYKTMYNPVLFMRNTFPQNRGTVQNLLLQKGVRKLTKSQLNLPYVLSKLSEKYSPQEPTFDSPALSSDKAYYRSQNNPELFAMPHPNMRTHWDIYKPRSDFSQDTDVEPDGIESSNQTELAGLITRNLRNLGHYIVAQDCSRPFSTNMINNYIDYINRMQTDLKEKPNK